MACRNTSYNIQFFHAFQFSKLPIFNVVYTANVVFFLLFIRENQGGKGSIKDLGGRFVRQRDSASIRGQPEGEMFTSILYKKKKKKKSVFLLLHGVGNISIYFGADAVGARIGRRGSQGQLLGAPTPSTRASPPPLGILAVCHSPYYRLEMRAAPQIGRQQI